MIQDDLKKQLTDALEMAFSELDKAERPEIEIETPNNPEHGDFSTNIALVLSGLLDPPPRQLAERIVDHLPQSQAIQRTQVAGPGFINFYLHPIWLHEVLQQCLTHQERYGCSDYGAGQKVHLDFVSANPVGPIHIGNARGGPFGDALANLLAACGYQVHREYYVNDSPDNTQRKLFAASVQARYLQLLDEDVELPEDGYQGEYVTDLARRLLERDGVAHRDVSRDEQGAWQFFPLVEDWMLEMLREDCEAMGVRFDNWFREGELHRTRRVDAEIEQLVTNADAYEKDGATWLRATKYGDEKDRVLVRSNGSPTYIASDLAYTANKFSRGFKKLFFVLGPDHAGYVPRLKAVIAALGAPPDTAEIIIYQTVRFLDGGQAVRLSKRRGQIVTIREIIDDIGRDAVRFFFLMRSVDAHLDFDLDLARRQSEENPVYYVQYAHARICSIQREATKREFEILPLEEVDLSVLTAPDELTLLRKIADYPQLVQRAAVDRAPHRLPHFAGELAQTFHQFYTTCRVLDADQPALSQARLKLVQGTQIVLQNLLGLLGITAPEQM